MAKKIKQDRAKLKNLNYETTLTVENVGEVKVRLDRKYFTTMQTFIDALKSSRFIEDITYDDRTYKQYQNDFVVKTFYDQIKAHAEAGDRKMTVAEQDRALRKSVRRAANYYTAENSKIRTLAMMIAAIEPNFVVTNALSGVQVSLADHLEKVNTESNADLVDELNQSRRQNGLPEVEIEEWNPVEQRIVLFNALTEEDETFAQRLAEVMNTGLQVVTGEVEVDELGFRPESVAETVVEETRSDSKTK